MLVTERIKVDAEQVDMTSKLDNIFTVIDILGLGINVHDTLQFLDAIEHGKFLVVGLVINRRANQAEKILENVERNAIAVY